MLISYFRQKDAIPRAIRANGYYEYAMYVKHVSLRAYKTAQININFNIRRDKRFCQGIRMK